MTFTKYWTAVALMFLLVVVVVGCHTASTPTTTKTSTPIIVAGEAGDASTTVTDDTGTTYIAGNLTFLETSFTPLSPPPDAPPTTVHVGPYRYRIVYGSDAAMWYCYGQIDYARREIWLRRSMTPEDLRETLLHELMHAAIDIGAGNTQDAARKMMNENEYIEATAPMLLATLQQNPKLAQWLARLTSPPPAPTPTPPETPVLKWTPATTGTKK